MNILIYQAIEFVQSALWTIFVDKQRVHGDKKDPW